MAGREWLEGATKMYGQFSGGHVKWSPETTNPEVEKQQNAPKEFDTFDRPLDGKDNLYNFKIKRMID